MGAHRPGGSAVQTTPPPHFAGRLEKISEEIEFLVAVQRGLKALDEGRVVSHEDVKARVASWAHRGRK